MATITPHRDGVEQGIQGMRDYDARRPPPCSEAERAYRALTIASTEAALFELADARDRNIDDAQIGGAFCGALGNVIASFCSTLADTDPEKTQRAFTTTMEYIYVQARRRLQREPGDAHNDVVVDAPAMGRA
ncbi:hypothetical protein [uncultured Methylobacterium sp.]|uniref:hypothetical protein n=1 Tax=uncultured Methylobacterium sp. TaxID=157278 RepID=UPI0035CA974C